MRALVLSLMFVAPACGRTELLDLGPSPPVRDLAVQFDLAAPDLFVRTDECADGPRRLFVVDDNQRLARFRPDTLTFTEVGSLRCPTSAGSTPFSMPFSMAVEQSGAAWVVYSSGELFRVDTTDASCRATGYIARPSSDPFTVFGMSFVPDAPNGAIESLFVAGESFNQLPGRLGRIDLASLTLTEIAPFSGLGSPELSGSPDGRLFGFFPTESMPRVSEIDPQSGVETQVRMLPELRASSSLGNSAWAFAYWGGDFWIFLQRGTDSSSKVFRLGADGSFQTALPYTGRSIVGAGVSTCKRVN